MKTKVVLCLMLNNSLYKFVQNLDFLGPFRTSEVCHFNLKGGLLEMTLSDLEGVRSLNQNNCNKA